jgi:two-component system CheB/CheR fusion protein
VRPQDASDTQEWIGTWLRLMLDRPDDYAVLLTDPQGVIVAWLRGAEHILGHTREEAIGQPLEIIFTPEDRHSRIAQHELNIAEAVGKAQDDRWHMRKDGSRFWGSGMTASIRSPDGKLLGFAKIVRDRTDLRTQVETLKNRLQAELAAKGLQVSNLGLLAHELRNPLQPLGTATQLIRRLVSDRDDLKVPLQVIDRQVGTLQRLLDDLLDMVRAGTGKLRLEFTSACLQDELDATIASVEGVARAKGIQLQALLPEIPVRIDIDRDRFQQVVVNLLNNAIKYTPPGGSIWLKATVDTGHAVLRVQDTGIGIPPELQPRIFELFTQGLNASSKREGGLGIGLAVVKDIVALHSGTVAVRSEGIGKGSEFVIRLPLHQPAQPAAVDAA